MGVDSGGCGDLESDASYTGATLVKQGAATLTWRRNLNVGPVRVEEGTLRLAAEDSLVAGRGQDVTLATGSPSAAADFASASTPAGCPPRSWRPSASTAWTGLMPRA